MAYVVEREFLDDKDALRRAHEAHWQYLRRLADAGELLGCCPPGEDGSGEILLFEVSERESLRCLLNADPHVRARLVTQERIREWQVILGSPGLNSEGPPLRAASSLAERAASASGEGSELTPHEHRIADLMLDGMTNRQIAAFFSVSPRAVEQHITRIYQKLSIRRRAQLAAALHGRSTVRTQTGPRRTAA
ncbi:LuxR C-terminal-related transcriptional regulator [Kitasatospora sp. HPMI-4]|uniref:LuxR C-terminal-related transcriptional regulator n=1 Tax=Kitasatospora sp. HPMI-4 TaxID=3448443 RepID=UPI003F1B3CA0